MSRPKLLSALLLTAAGFAATSTAAAQTPFVVPGEHLVYRVHSEHFGSFGKAHLRVEALDTIHGVPAYRLAFDFSARIILFKVSDQTRSWLAVDGLHTLRYTKRERSPVSSHDEQVEINLEQATWSTPRETFALASSRPLDELSFIYLVRGLQLQLGEELVLHRHFDERRNAVRVRALKREVVDGRAAFELEMRVPDIRQKHGSSVFRFVVTDDAERMLLRIETTMPMAGTIIMTLESASHRQAGRAVGKPPTVA